VKIVLGAYTQKDVWMIQVNEKLRLITAEECVLWWAFELLSGIQVFDRLLADNYLTDFRTSDIRL